MKTQILALACAMITFSSAAQSTPATNSGWTGVWESKLDGVTSLILTLADDAGALDGTIVFRGVSREGGTPHAIGTEPHTLIHPHLEGAKLSFQVKRGNGSTEILNMSVELTKGGKAEFRCSNCSSSEVLADLEKE